MSQPIFKFCSFAEDLTGKILLEQPGEKTVFIFPNERSKKAAMHKFQQLWEFSDTRFITMEELKEQLFISTLPVLREEKRTLAFFDSLTPNDRRHFKINNYFQSIELANNCFNLWQEFNEECAAAKAETALLNENLANTDWQILTWQRLQAIKQQYSRHINSIGFDDPVFVYHQANLNDSFLQHYERFVFANQFYYTTLEKTIIERLGALEKIIVIYYQLPERLVNKQDLSIQPFQLPDLLPEMQTESIHIFTGHNDFTMMVALARQMEEQRPGQIVNIGFNKNPWSRFLSPDQFALGNSKTFTSCSIYRFFTALYQMVDGLLWESQGKKLLLPLQNLLNSVLCEDFFFYFSGGQSAAEQQTSHEATLKYLYTLIDLEYKYTDLRLEYFHQIHPSPALTCLTNMLQFVQDFIQVNTIRDLITRFDATAGGIDLKKILLPQELHNTNIIEVFYAMLADFVSSEEIGLAGNWQHYFPTNNPFLKNLQTAGGLLRLFLDYMKPKTFLPLQRNKAQRTEIASLLDTRNLSFPAVAILNVTEGKIPQSRQAQFLFTDRQRKLLGLKTFEDIRLRDKYYFFRLALTSRQVSLYTQINNEKNVEVSSFIEELLLYFPQDKLSVTDVRETACRAVYRQIFTDNNYRVNDKLIYQPDFYRLPCNIQTDFSPSGLLLTFTSCKDLQTNPFIFYIRHIAGLDEWQKQVANDLSPRLLGNLTHDILSQIWQTLNEQGRQLSGFGFSPQDQTLIQNAAVKTLSRPKYYFSLLHDHTQVYFEKILLQVLLEGITGFFHYLQQFITGPTRPEIIPEQERSSQAERLYKTLIPAAGNALHIPVKIRGRADLRIVFKDERYLIFDYKTGNFAKEQLIIYELFYYLLDRPELLDRIESWFYQVIKNESSGLVKWYKKIGKEQLIATFIAEIRDSLDDLVVNGYRLPEQKSKLNDLPEITRKDLFLTKSLQPATLREQANG
ncbi:MAG TPA: PD-(D/E)XK nuclease family protein [bacterium]|nr:PD-(D/E)XK nuclease family protein [bacterium]HPN45021.1 PD-(D/E)XK nuclease family protein [bacterium]